MSHGGAASQTLCDRRINAGAKPLVSQQTVGFRAAVHLPTLYHI